MSINIQGFIQQIPLKKGGTSNKKSNNKKSNTKKSMIRKVWSNSRALRARPYGFIGSNPISCIKYPRFHTASNIIKTMELASQIDKGTIV